MKKSGIVWESSVFYDKQLSKHFVCAYLVGNTALCILIIAANSVLIHALRKLGKLKAVSFILALCLSIADICVGIAQLPVQFLLLLPQPASIDAKTICAQFAIFFFSHMSGGITITMTFDRYIHMKYSSKYNDIMTKRRLIVIFVVIFGVDLMLTCILTVSSFYSFNRYMIVTLSLSYALSMLYIFITYTRTYVCIRSQVRATNIRNIATVNGRRIRNPEHRFARMMVFILGCLFICYLPSIVISIVRAITELHGNEVKNLKYAVLCSYSLAYCNSFSNSLIIILGNNQVKRRVISIFTSLPCLIREDDRPKLF